MGADVHLELEYDTQPIRQASSLKYRGLIYNQEHTSERARSFHLLHRCANARSGKSRSNLLLLYKSYAWPIRQFDCTMFLGYRIIDFPNDLSLNAAHCVFV